ARLVAALPADARLLLLGDRDQLASVEAGAGLGDGCGPGPGVSAAFRARVEGIVGMPLPAGAGVASPLADSVVLLTKSHRFGRDSGIGRVPAALPTAGGAPERRRCGGRQAASVCGEGTAWSAGRPVLITQNDYALRLFNGDVGIALPDAQGRLAVCFEG